MEQIRISAKNLGELALPSFCPRCFWVKQHSARLPFQFFPGIFSSIDAYTKRVERAYFEQHHELLQWLRNVGLDGESLPVPHHTKFRTLYAASNIWLTGVPDAIFRLANGEYAIIDYKTAKFTGAQDSLFPLYDAQLNGYAYIAERNGFAPVTRLALVYYEPVTEVVNDAVDTLVNANGFALGFTPHWLPIEKRAMIEPLLERYRAVYDLPGAPAGRNGCKDCAALDALVALLPRD